jgi:UrcA family protein
MLKTLPALGAIIAASVLVVPTVSEAADTDTETIHVSYADLNLASPIGRNDLELRIAYAADVVCGPADNRDVPFERAVAACRKATYSDAQPAFNAAVASAMHPSVTVASAQHPSGTVLSETALVVAAHWK